MHTRWSYLAYPWELTLHIDTCSDAPLHRTTFELHCNNANQWANKGVLKPPVLPHIHLHCWKFEQWRFFPGGYDLYDDPASHWATEMMGLPGALAKWNRVALRCIYSVYCASDKQRSRVRSPQASSHYFACFPYSRKHGNSLRWYRSSVLSELCLFPWCKSTPCPESFHALQCVSYKPACTCQVCRTTRLNLQHQSIPTHPAVTLALLL